MRSIDIHAHVTPPCFWRATENGGEWHTVKRERDASGGELAVPVAWIQGMASLTQAEKDAILWKNLERLLGI